MSTAEHGELKLWLSLSMIEHPPAQISLSLSTLSMLNAHAQCSEHAQAILLHKRKQKIKFSMRTINMLKTKIISIFKTMGVGGVGNKTEIDQLSFPSLCQAT